MCCSNAWMWILAMVRRPSNWKSCLLDAGLLYFTVGVLFFKRNVEACGAWNFVAAAVQKGCKLSRTSRASLSCEAVLGFLGSTGRRTIGGMQEFCCACDPYFK